MLDWLKRKSAPAPSEQLLESEGQKPVTDVRLERLLGRLGPDSRPPREPVESRNTVVPPPSTEPVAEALNENARPLPVDTQVAAVPPPSADGGADTRFAVR